MNKNLNVSILSKNMIKGLLKLLRREEKLKKLQPTLVGANKLSIDFRLECGTLISVPKRYMGNSDFVRSYALKDTVVIDIEEVPEPKKMFKETCHKEFYIYLDSGSK